MRNSLLGDIAVVPRIGIIFPTESGLNSAVTVGGEARFQFYSIDEGLSGSLGVKYMVPSSTDSGHIVIVPMTANVVYEVFVEGKGTELYISGGLGLYPWSADFRGGSDSGLSFGVQAALGAEPRVGPGSLLAEVGYSYAGARYDSRERIHLGGVSFEIGYKVIF